jgi:hypothetical protein
MISPNDEIVPFKEGVDYTEEGEEGEDELDCDLEDFPIIYKLKSNVSAKEIANVLVRGLKNVMEEYKEYEDCLFCVEVEDTDDKWMFGWYEDDGYWSKREY